MSITGSIKVFVHYNSARGQLCLCVATVEQKYLYLYFQPLLKNTTDISPLVVQMQIKNHAT